MRVHRAGGADACSPPCAANTSAGIRSRVTNLGERVPELVLCRLLVGTQDPHVRSFGIERTV